MPMDINSEVVDTPPRPAATVVLIRDTAAGLETFLIRRHGLSDVLAGAHVFPGGKVDPHDMLSESQALLAQPGHDLATTMNESDLAPNTAASLYLAAIRETFEESGVLLARGALAEHVHQAADLLRQGQRFDTILSHLRLQLDATELLPWSRWITPRVPMVTNKRFDTRFFIATLPPGQTAGHDDHEATASTWLRPRLALQMYWDGAIDLAPPQIMTLAHLSHYPTVHHVMAAQRAQRPALILPEPFQIDGGRLVCYPGDERHTNRLRAMPGPTRLMFRHQRFEPMEGFDALFSPGPNY